MQTLVVGAEKSLADVLKRAYPGRMSAGVSERVGHAVRKANPQVDFDELRRGMVLQIPDVPDAPESSARRADLRLDEITATGLEAVQARVRSDLEEMVAAAGREEGAASKERAQLVRALESDEVGAAAEGDATLAEEIDSVRRAIEEEEAGAEKRTAMVNRLGAEWADQMDVLKLILPQ